MVAKSATAITNRINARSNPALVRETVQKVERCMTRLQELQLTVAGGLKPSSSTSRVNPRTSLRCKQEYLRIKTVALQRSPTIRIQERAESQEWQKMSLPAMLLNETLAEILQASKLVSKLAASSAAIDPRTPDVFLRKMKPQFEDTELKARRANEKQVLGRTLRLDYASPVLRRARSRINFKSTSPLNKNGAMNNPKAWHSVSANRVSPKIRPWTKKTVVLFPNQLFLPKSPASTNQKKFYKTRSPIIGRTLQAPHKFLIKASRSTLGSQFESKKAVPGMPVSYIRDKVPNSKPRRCSFSPSKLVKRLVSPLKARLSDHKVGGGLMTEMKQRPNCYEGVICPVKMRLVKMG